MTPGNDVAPRIGARAFLDLGRRDVAWLLGLVVLAFAIRVAGPIFPDFLERPFGGAPVHAWGLSHPFNKGGCQPDVPVGPHGAPEKRCGFVFDEVYFPVDAAKDLRQPTLDYFDPEPPIAKLVMAPPIAWFGFTPFAWRIAPAIFGSLLTGVVYLIARRLRRERFFAVIAGGAVALDGLAIVESRTGLIDIIAVTLAAFVYWAFLLHWQSRTRGQWLATLYTMAVLVGLAFGAKLTAIAPVALAGALIAGRGVQGVIVNGVRFSRRWLGDRERAHPLAYGFRSVRHRQRDDGGAAQAWRGVAGRWAVVHYGFAVLLAGTVFVTSFARYSTISHSVPHYVSCTQKDGPRERPGAPPDLQTPSVTVQHGVPIPSPLHMVANTADIMAAGLQYHEHECRPHPYASRWYTWPVMYHPVLFYYDDQDYRTPSGVGKVASVSNLGNPAVWWLGALALMFCAWRMTAGWHMVVRGAVSAVGAGGLALLITSFRSAQQLDSVSVLVHPGKAFVVGLLAIAVFGAAAVAAATFNARLVPAFIVLGYLVAWLMWSVGNEARVLFFYHALGSLPLLALALAYAVTALRRVSVRVAGRTVELAALSYSAVGLVVAAFVFFLPLWTALPLFAADRALRLWMSW